MGLFNFLFDQQAPTGGASAPTMPMDPGMSAPPPAASPPAPGMAPAAPATPSQPGLLHGLLARMRTPDANGMTFADKLSSAGMMMRDDADPSSIATLQRTRLAQMQFQRQMALQQRGNQAFRAAYQNGKFNPTVYAQVMGDALDPEALAKMATTFNPKQSLQDGFVIQNDPITGEFKIVGQRPQNYGEQTAADQAAESHRHNTVEEGQGASRISEDARHNRVGEGISAGQLGVAQSHLGLDQANQAFEHQKFGAGQNPGVPVVTNPGDYARLPKGTPYVAPDGSLRHKQ